MDLYHLHYPTEDKPEDSAYYYWYRYMRLVDGYGPKHPLWADFGDIKHMSFWDWWCEHELIFMTGELPGVEELTSDEEIELARSEGAYIVRVDPSCTRDYLRFYFEGFLDEKGIRNTAGRRKHEDEVKFAMYPFFQRPDIRSLKKSLEVLELRMKKKPDRPTLYEIGVALKLNPSAVIKKKDPPATVTAKKNVMNATVSRYEKWGKTILENVSKGLFPVM